MTYKMDPSSDMEFSPYFFHTNPEALVGFQSLRFQHPNIAIVSYTPRDRDLYAKHKEIFLFDADPAYWYAKNIGHDIETFRAALITGAFTIGMDYINEILPHYPRDPKIEQYLLSIAPLDLYSNTYVRSVMHGPWPAYERELAKAYIENQDRNGKEFIKIHVRFPYHRGTLRDTIREYASIAYPTGRYSKIMQDLLDRIKNYEPKP